MALRLANKTALITGGASGIGRATALRFAEEGAAVVVADRNGPAAHDVAAEIGRLGQKNGAFEVDVADEDQVEAMADYARQVLGSIDILVAAAGVSHANYRGGPNDKIRPRPVPEKSLADWRKVIGINLDGVFLCDRAVARQMIAAGKGGRIINIASAAAKIPIPGLAEYSVSKAGVWMLTRVLAVELAAHGITANAIGPGFINTPMSAGIKPGQKLVGDTMQRILLGRFGEPIDVANTALFLASDEGAYYTGQILHPDGGVLLQ